MATEKQYMFHNTGDSLFGGIWAENMMTSQAPSHTLGKMAFARRKK